MKGRTPARFYGIQSPYSSYKDIVSKYSFKTELVKWAEVFSFNDLVITAYIQSGIIGVLVGNESAMFFNSSRINKSNNTYDNCSNTRDVVNKKSNYKGKGLNQSNSLNPENQYSL